MKEFTVIKILNKMKFLSRLMGIDHEDLIKILTLKLTLDGRRENTFTKGNNIKVDQDGEIGVLKSYWGYGLFGLLLIPITLVGTKPFFSLTLFFGVVLFLLITTMISDFSSVLLDTKDKSILLTKPIDRKTLTAARMIHIFIYIFTIMSFLTIPSLISYTIKYGGIMLIMLMVTIILLCLLSILFTSFLYTIMLKVFDGEKLKDVINSFQIVLTITISVGYQLISRVFNIVEADFVFNVKWWSFLMVPVWFAAPFKIVFESDYSISIIILSIIAVIVPITAITINAKWVAPNFESYLNKLDQSEKGKVQRKSLKTIWDDSFINIAGRSNEEKTLIRFAHSILTKERELKLRIYPSIAMAAAFPFIMMLANLSDYDSILEFLINGINLHSILYFYLTALFASSLVFMISYSSNYKAGWIFNTLPISDVSVVRKASTKAYLMCYYFPIMMVVMIGFALRFGPISILHTLLIGLSGLLSTIVVIKVSGDGMPFTDKYSVQSQKENSMTRFVSMSAATGISFLIHKVFFDITLAIGIACICYTVVVLYMWKTTFSKVKKENTKDVRKIERATSKAV